MKMSRLLTILGLASCLNAVAAPRTELIPLHYRMADELLPLVKSMLADEGRVSAYGNQLMVNAEPAKLMELRHLLQQLDTPPKRLLISVDSGGERTAHQDGYRFDGSVSAGNVEIVSGRAERYGGDQLRIVRRGTTNSSGSLQQVQTTEGYPARLQIGQQMPLTRRQRDAYGYPREYTEYREIQRGFEVVANVQGERVQLSIRSQQDRLENARGAIDTQVTDTRVSGRLGEWIELSNFEESRALERSGLLSRETGNARQMQSLRLKVELLE